MQEKHRQYINRCIQLAKLGQGKTQSNPMVGAVLVYQDEIIGEGYHAKYGEAHAEVNCIKNVTEKNKERIPFSTLYVSLEPCNHTGKTPPCSHAIVEAGIQNVVVGTLDLNPQVSSKGIAYLEEKGVQVSYAYCEEAFYKLNKVFFTNHKRKRAFVKLKWAESQDGFIGKENEQIAISSPATNIINHKYRTATDGILVGYQTALVDQPELNARHWQGKQPTRIIMDWQCALPLELISKQNRKTIVLNSLKSEVQESIEYIQVEQKATAVATILYEYGICSLLVEGGAKTHSFFIEGNCWDEAIVIKGAHNLGNGIQAAQLPKKNIIHEKKISTDHIVHYSNSEFIQ